VSTRVAEGYYLHAERKEIERHFTAYQNQGKNPQKLQDKRYHRDFCAHCYSEEDEFGSSEVFNYFLIRKRQAFDIISTTGKSVQYYAQAYKSIASYNYKKNEVLRIIKKCLKSFAYGAPRNLSFDAKQTFLFIKESCDQILEDSDYEQTVLDVNTTPTGSKYQPQNNNKGKGVDTGLEKFDILHFEHTEDTEDNESIGFTDLHLLDKGVNTLAGFLNKLQAEKEADDHLDTEIINEDIDNNDNHTIASDDTEDTEESDEEFEMNQDQFVQALQGIHGQNEEHLCSEQGILTVEPFGGKGTEDPVS
jgi:hypothetical protein